MRTTVHGVMLVAGLFVSALATCCERSEPGRPKAAPASVTSRSAPEASPQVSPQVSPLVPPQLPPQVPPQDHHSPSQEPRPVPHEPVAAHENGNEHRVYTERWPSGATKFEYEMARGPDGKYAKDGFIRAFYEEGGLEREGQYRHGERVGRWRYYQRDGRLIQESDFGSGRPSRLNAKSSGAPSSTPNGAAP